MIIQRWPAKMMPMQLPAFLQTLKDLNASYREHDREEWGRVYFELYSGHEIYMEREVPSVAALDADEMRSLEPAIWTLKERLLESTVPGTVAITHYHRVDV